MPDQTTVTTETKTYTQAEVDELLGRKLDTKGKEFSKEKDILLKSMKDLEDKIQELETAKPNQSVEELKAQLKAKETAFKTEKQELIKTHEEVIGKWNKDKINGTYATLVGDKISYEKDLVIEHLVNHSEFDATLKEVMYTDPKTGDTFNAEKAVELIAKSRPALIAGPQQGTGLRAATPPRGKPPGKPKSEWTSKEYFQELDKEIENKGKVK
jgi:vacuolar-type H+-ATPase subunit I/STV1